MDTGNNLAVKPVSNNDEIKYTHIVYRNITGLGILLHAAYALMFGFLRYPVPCTVNIFSTVFYTLMLLIAARKGRFALAVSLIHFESCIFVIIHTVLFGWGTAFYMFLAAMASLVYFCPFRSRYVPYLFSLLHISVFFILRFYTLGNLPLRETSNLMQQVFFVCNCLGSFTVILYVAYVSNASAVSGKKELIKQNRGLQRLANHDQLTNLYSRTCLRNQYDKYYSEESVLAIGDIDDFKYVNDTYGHICGDAILKKLAEQMQAKLDSKVFICRWGGEEFLFIFPDMSLCEAKCQLEDFRKWIDQYEFRYQDIKIHITMTFGICKGSENLSLNKWVDQADTLLYKGKHSGKNKVVSE